MESAKLSTTENSFDEFETYLNTTRRLSESQPSTSLHALLGETSPSPTPLEEFSRTISIESKDSLCLSDAEKEADEFVRQQQDNTNQSTSKLATSSVKQEENVQLSSPIYKGKTNLLNESLYSSTTQEGIMDDDSSITIESLLRTNDFSDTYSTKREVNSNTLSQINELDDSINSHDNNSNHYNTIDLMGKKRVIRRQLSEQLKQNSTDKKDRNNKNRLQHRYSLAIEDFKTLRSNLGENMERNLQRTEQLSLKPKTSDHYRSVDNILRHNYDINVGRTHSDVAHRNPTLNRYSSQERIFKRHSGMNFDEEYFQTRGGIDRLYTNNNFDPTYKRAASPVHSPVSAEMQREHQSNLRDQAARSNFERYLRGSINAPTQSTEHMFHNNTMPPPLDVDVGYGGSGSTSPREEVLMTSDQLSSRSGSINSHHSRTSSALASVDSGVRMSFVGQHNSLVVVAIDFGTTFSGYAFSFTRDSSSVHMMRRWEGGDPGVTNQKTPTTLLLKPDGIFHSFGFGARDFYHDLDASDARKWLYFDKFKMSLHSSEDLHAGIEIKAANGKMYPALKVFSHALRFFKQHVLAELSDQSTAKLGEEDITWVLTVPAIWRQPAKQFMRTAAYEAGIASLDHPDRLLIALEPEAASIFCRKLRIRDCVIEDDLKAKAGDDTLISEDFAGITQYIVVDCGGGTVDLTVHELDVTQGTLKELHKGTGGPSGATGVDREFEKLLKRIFDADFIEKFKVKRPAAWVDLMISFEAKKRTARHDNESPLNLSLPFSFIEYHKKHRRCSVETAIKKFKNPDIKWSSQGMLRFSANIMQQLFEPVVNDIIGHIQHLLTKVSLKHVEHLFLVGGFAESPLLQHNIRESLEGRVRVIIPNDVGLAILKGAVLFGLDPTVVRVRRSAYTYGVGVLNKFDSEKHEQTKRVVKDGIVWCKDIFDTFVRVDESVGLGDRVTRSYAPARSKQKSTVINIYCTEKLDVLYTTDKGVTRCGKLRIEMPDVNPEDIPVEKRGKPRELQATMLFGDTEIKVAAVDVLSARAARATIDFLNY